jgi:peptidoglycan/xylan/chitin deacetylase (PgdA/CDA1 family)
MTTHTSDLIRPRARQSLNGAIPAPGAAFACAFDILGFLERGSKPLLPVLTYHQVGEAESDPALTPGLISATPAEFELQAAYLARRRRVLSLAELLEIRRSGARYPSRAVVLAFDHSCTGFALHVWPVLRSLGVPAILFVPTADPALDGPARAGDPRARATEPLAWEDLRQLAAQGVALVPHTRTHPSLGRISLEQAHDEIAGSLFDLHRQIGLAPRVFAYPGRDIPDVVVELVRDADFELAFSSEHGVNRFGSHDWLRLERIDVLQPGAASPAPASPAQPVLEGA